MRCLITGSSGFIGSRLTQELRDKGYEVIEYDILVGKDLMNNQQLSDAIQGCDVVIHNAAAADINWVRQFPYDAVLINVGTTHDVVHLCAKYHKWLIFASTVCVYGNQEKFPETEETLPNPSELYACSKYACEWIIRGYGHNYGVPWTILRYATIYGEGMRPALGVRIFLEQAMKGEPITVHGDGKQTRTQTYIGDLVDGIIAVLENPEKSRNEIFNLTNENRISAIQMAEDIKELTKSKSEIVCIPQRPNQTFHEEISAKKIFDKLGWKAKTSWEEGLEKTFIWLEKSA